MKGVVEPSPSSRGQQRPAVNPLSGPHCSLTPRPGDTGHKGLGEEVVTGHPQQDAVCPSEGGVGLALRVGITRMWDLNQSTGDGAEPFANLAFGASLG